MTKRARCKFKTDRHLGVNLWGRPKSPINTCPYGPGQHRKPHSHSRLNDYSLRLRAKQKLKKYYGNILERQFRQIFEEALSHQGDTAQNLVNLLERRLDTITYRLKFAPTVFSARQLVNHGHILVNNKRVNIPSYRVKEQDIIEVRPSSRTMPLVLASQESSEREVPCYLHVDHKVGRGSLLRRPSLQEIPYPIQMEPKLVVEFYSR